MFKLMRRLFSSSPARPPIEPRGVALGETIGGLGDSRGESSETYIETGSTPRVLTAELANEQLERPIVFDPALIPYTAHRAGEPQFVAPEDAQRWYELRAVVMDHILRVIAKSPYAGNLILRGSVVLASWYPLNARRPGDLDWVVTPPQWPMESDEGRQLIAGISALIRDTKPCDEVSIPDEHFVTDDIWTYEKAPGKRLIIPWTCVDARFDGTVQMDFVFREQVPSAPETTAISIAGREPIELLAASKAQSLAWKILWLAGDAYPQGKDLYDAVLLAEDVSLSAELLRMTFLVAQEELLLQNLRNNLLREFIEWEDFQREYPDVAGTAAEWKQRLVQVMDL